MTTKASICLRVWSDSPGWDDLDTRRAWQMVQPQLQRLGQNLERIPGVGNVLFPGFTQRGQVRVIFALDTEGLDPEDVPAAARERVKTALRGVHGVKLWTRD